MITVTVDKIDGSDITNDIRAIDPKMISPGSIRPSTANDANSACIMEVLTWDGNIQNYRAVRWVLTDTYTTIKNALGLTSVTLVEVNGETVTTDIRAINEAMMVAGSMKPKTANDTGSVAIFSVQKWDNNLPGYVSETWEISATYASLKTALDALNNPSFGTASGTDTYAVTLSPAMTSYETGVPFYVKFTNPNTGAATLNVNGLGAKDLKKEASTALAASDIIADKVYTLVYDGTNIQIEGIAQAAGSTITFLQDTAADIINKTYTLVGGTISITPDTPAQVTANTIVIANFYNANSVGPLGVSYAVDIIPNTRIDIFAFDAAGAAVATDDSDLKVTIFNVA